MKKIYVTDHQYDCLLKIATSQGVRVSSLVHIAVEMVFHPVVVNHLDIPFLDKKNESICCNLI